LIPAFNARIRIEAWISSTSLTAFVISCRPGKTESTVDAILRAETR
jgi:hypothetical protein